jgi:hypothetical protein
MSERVVPIRYVWTTVHETHEGEVGCLSEALDVFRQAQQHPGLVSPMVMYWDERGRELGVGAGRELSAATFQFSLDPPYFVSRGGVVGTSMDFICGNEPTEFEADNIISESVAMQLIADFFESMDLPKSVEWAEV